MEIVLVGTRALIDYNRLEGIIKCLLLVLVGTRALIDYNELGNNFHEEHRSFGWHAGSD